MEDGLLSKVLFMWTLFGTIYITHDKCFSLPGPGEGDTLRKGNLCSAFRQKRGEQRVFLAYAASQLPSTQNNPYAKVAYLGVVYSDPLQFSTSP